MFAKRLLFQILSRVILEPDAPIHIAVYLLSVSNPLIDRVLLMVHLMISPYSIMFVLNRLNVGK